MPEGGMLGEGMLGGVITDEMEHKREAGEGGGGIRWASDPFSSAKEGRRRGFDTVAAVPNLNLRPLGLPACSSPGSLLRFPCGNL